MSEFSEFQEFVSKLQTAKGSVKTIPAVFGIELKEVYITKWLAYMLSTDIIGVDILNAFVSLCRENETIGYDDDVKVHAEYSFPSQKRIDILVFTDNYLIGIENKLDAAEGTDQTNIYSKEMEKMAGGRKIVKIFIRPEYNNSRSDYFDNITYTQLLEKIDGTEYSDEVVDPFDKMMFIELKKYIKECLCVNYEYPRMSEKAQLYYQYADVVRSAEKEYDDFARAFPDWLESALKALMEEHGYLIYFDKKDCYCRIFRDEWESIRFHFEIVWKGTLTDNKQLEVYAHLEYWDEDKAEGKDISDIYRAFDIDEDEPKFRIDLTKKQYYVDCDFSSETAAKATVDKILEKLKNEEFQQYARKADEYLSKQK